MTETMQQPKNDLEKFGASINKLINKVGSEAFWPTSMDHECDKASRILKSFCNEGFYKEQPETPTHGPKHAPKALVTIPKKVIQNAVGLAIFSVGRIGVWGTSLSGGSGILVARKEDGMWSPPSGLTVNTLGFGFVHGIDVYDCVVVINNREILKAFSKTRISLGGEASLTLGPVGAGAHVDAEIKKNPEATLTYIKSRGLYAGIQLDGTIMRGRDEENEVFYREQVSVERILAGRLEYLPAKAKGLMDVVVAAEGFVDQGNEQVPEYSAREEQWNGDNEKGEGEKVRVLDEKREVRVEVQEKTGEQEEWEKVSNAEKKA